MSTNKLTDLGKTLSDVREQVQKDAKGYIRDAVQAFLEKHPTVTAFRWNQYIPGFNDGAPCLFSLDCVFLKTDVEFNEEMAEEWNVEEDNFVRLDECQDWTTKKFVPGITEEMRDDANSIWDGLNALGDILGEIFQHNATITIERDSEDFDVEYYDCGY